MNHQQTVISNIADPYRDHTQFLPHEPPYPVPFVQYPQAFRISKSSK